ncbi:MAG: hypothetical protein JSW33_09620 [bacterium]|nr:MAG: hypothetical protein JSW33_09620 [bacterium]
MKSHDSKNDWQKIGPLPGLPYAQMISEVLEKKQIPYSLSQDGVATAYGFTGTSLAGNEAFIWVPAEYVDQVREIIDQLIDHI